MAWTTPRTWATNELVTASLMNTHLRDNLSYLLAPNYFRVTESTGTYTTTSNSLVAVGANYNQTISTNGGHLLAIVSGQISGTSSVQFYIDIDGAVTQAVATTGATTSFNFSYIFTGLSAGSHSASLKWVVAASSTGTITKTTVPLTFIGIEI